MKVDVDAIKRLMIEQQLTLKGLSKKTGLSQITLASILKSSGELKRYKTAGALVEGLGVRLEDVLKVS